MSARTPNCSADFQPAVSQVSNLQDVIEPRVPGLVQTIRSSGTQQAGSLRYGRLETCATFRNSASVLVGVLWCIAILAVVVIGVLHSSRLDLTVAKNQGDMIQAHYLALAGVEKAKALIYLEAKERKRNARHHSGALYDDSEHFKDIAFGRGEFRVFRQGSEDEGGRVIYGVADEESKLNLNTATAEDLSKLYRMTPDVAAAIMDWRDGDNNASPNGAEADYYASLSPPYLPRNGPFSTVRELLMVRGVTPELFLGEDTNQNGLLDPEEDDGNQSLPEDNHDGILDAGWSASLTVDSTTRNEDAAGLERVNVQSADENGLTAVKGITLEIAKAIVSSRSQNKLETLADLLEVTAPVPPAQQFPGAQSPAGNQGNPSSRGGIPSGPPAPVRGRVTQQSGTQGSPPPAVNRGGPQQQTGPKVINEDLLIDIADQVTTTDDANQVGLVNLNTASTTVLRCLPGVDEQIARAIVSYRKSAGFFPNVAALLKVDGVNRQIFKQLVPRVTVRSETFRILCEGRIPSSGAHNRIQVIVHVGPTTIETLSYREDL